MIWCVLLRVDGIVCGVLTVPTTIQGYNHPALHLQDEPMWLLGQHLHRRRRFCKSRLRGVTPAESNHIGFQTLPAPINVWSQIGAYALIGFSEVWLDAEDVWNTRWLTAL